MAGKLYGLGVGPGDPELITLKAKRIMEEADCIAVPKTKEGKRSFAFSIAEDIAGKGKPLLELVFPMSFDESVLENSWSNAIEEIRKVLDEGKDIAFITLGDPTVYSTYMYVHKAISKLGYDTEIIPGITSFCASASRAGISLGENRETIAVIPSAYECENLEQVLDSFDNIVLMKVYKSMDKLKKLLEKKGLARNAVIVSKCGTDEETVMFGMDREDFGKLSYFTTVIIKKQGELV
jgi:precorrin-2/cobalt-factor-2 C20-methyltransferase